MAKKIHLTLACGDYEIVRGVKVSSEWLKLVPQPRRRGALPWCGGYAAAKSGVS
jgi:hypothetical protein